MRLAPMLVYALLVSIAGMMILLAVGAYRGFDPLTESAIASGFIVIIALGAAVCCAIALEREVAPKLMLSGLIATAVSAAAQLCILWFDLDVRFPHAQRVAIWPEVWAAGVAVAALLLVPRSPGKWWRILRRLTIVLLLLFAAHVVLAVTFAPMNPATFSAWRQYEEIAMRIGTALGVLFLGGFATTLLTLWMVPAPSMNVRRPFALTCPRCNTEQTLETGGARCATCGLGITVNTL